MNKNYLYKSLPLFLFILLSSCTKNTIIEGNYITDNDVKQIIVGMDKQNVENILGPKTVNASFHENIWYYMYMNYEQYVSFISKKLVDSKIVKITFNDDKVAEVKVINNSEEKKLPISPNTTPIRLSKSYIKIKAN